MTNTANRPKSFQHVDNKNSWGIKPNPANRIHTQNYNSRNKNSWNKKQTTYWNDMSFDC